MNKKVYLCSWIWDYSLSVTFRNKKLLKHSRTMVSFLHPKHILMTAILLSISIFSFAYDFEVDGIYYNRLSDNTVEVTYNTKLYSGEIAIPESIKYDNVTYSVTSIGKRAFYDCDNLTLVIIPDGVTLIGDSAFASCSELTAINIPKTVTYIGEAAFSSCSGLAWVNIPYGVTSIKDNTFYDCHGLKAINIPEGVDSIGNYAFSGCGLTDIDIPDEVTYIGDCAFEYCSSLTSINIPDKVTYIGDFAFVYCSGLTSVNIPNELDSIRNSTFYGCIGLTSIIIPDAVSAIGDGAFCDCSGLTSISIGKQVTSIGRNAFRDCVSLTSVNIPDSVTSIGESAFCSCISLASINIPAGITSIGMYAFDCGENFKAVNITSVENWMKINMGKDAFSSSYDIIIDGNKLKDLVVPKSITYIGANSFNNCANLESITLHKDVAAIAHSAFNGCTNVKKIVCQGDTPPVCGNSALDGISRTECFLYVTDTESGYKYASPWNEFTHIMETTGISGVMEDRSVTVSSNNNQINISGTTNGETIEVYNVGGSKLKEIKANDESTTIDGLQSDNVYIVKIGGTKVKVVM